MSEIILTGIGLLLIIAAWRFVWLPTLVDSTRDELFDLRDRVLREYFVSRGIPLTHPLYLKLRTLLNGHLRHTESVNVWTVCFMQMEESKHRSAHPDLYKDVNDKFQTDDPKLKELVDEIRQKSSIAMLIYMVESSIFMMACALIAMPILWCKDKALFGTRIAIQARRTMEKCALVA